MGGRPLGYVDTIYTEPDWEDMLFVGNLGTQRRRLLLSPLRDLEREGVTYEKLARYLDAHRNPRDDSSAASQFEMADFLEEALCGAQMCIYCLAKLHVEECMLKWDYYHGKLFRILDQAFGGRETRRRYRLVRRVRGATPRGVFHSAVTPRDHLVADFERYLRACCRECGWWCVGLESRYDGWYGEGGEWMYAYGVLREYDIHSSDIPLNMARDFLIRHPDKLARVDPFRFEDLMAACLRDYYGDGEVVKLGGRRDHGIDIKVFRASGEAILVQVKRRGDLSKRESVQTVRNLHGVMLRDGVANGMIITTAYDFSPDAYVERQRLRERVHHYSLEFLSLNDVIDLLHLRSGTSRPGWEDAGLDFSPRPNWETQSVWVDGAAWPGTARSDDRSIMTQMTELFFG